MQIVKMILCGVKNGAWFIAMKMCVLQHVGNKIKLYKSQRGHCRGLKFISAKHLKIFCSFYGVKMALYAAVLFSALCCKKRVHLKIEVTKIKV